MPAAAKHAGQIAYWGGLLITLCGLAAACAAKPADTPPPTIAPAEAAVSPPVTQPPAGVVRPLAGHAKSVVFDAATASLVVLGPGKGEQAVVTAMPAKGLASAVTLLGPATAMTGDNRGHVFAATRGGYFRVDIAQGRVSRVPVDGHGDTDFTAIARRADGRLVLGSADGAVYTLSSDTSVGAELKIFARVDALVTQGNTAVVLDRGQTSVTTVDASGAKAGQALRAGEGATTLAVDPAGPGAGRRHPRGCAAGVRHRPADAAAALSRCGVRPTAWLGHRGWLGCHRQERIWSLVTIWRPEYQSRRCVIRPCSSRTLWPSTRRLAPCMWCRGPEQVCR